MKKFVRYFIVFPIGLVFIPFFALGFWVNPIELYLDYFEHLKSGESFVR